MRRLFDGRSKLEFPPPWWKVKREFLRVGLQMDDFILQLTGISAIQVYSKFIIDPRVTLKTGALPLGSRMALYVIFPSQGLQRSHSIALDYILECGYVPIVVSNKPLDPSAQATILARSACLIVRPNFGYDFAAYREGVRYLTPHIADLEYLALFNDSSWFPAIPDRNWLKEAEGLDRDYVGSVFHNAVDPTVNWDFRVDPYRPDSSRHNFHYGSYSLLVRRNVLNSPDFDRFWQSYRATNDKIRTVLRGEIGLTRMVVDAGFSHAATLDTNQLDRILRDLPDQDLREVAANILVPMHPALNTQRLDSLSSDPIDRPALINFILSAVVKEGPSYALADFDLTRRTGIFIKKSPLTQDRTSSQQTLNILGKLSSPQARVFHEEADLAHRRKFGAITPASISRSPRH